MNRELAERLQRACHAMLPPDTIPLNAVRFLHWVPGNENMWVGLKQCLAEYMAASLRGLIREPLMFFGLHSNIDVFPDDYKELFNLGAGYLPYNAGTDAVLNEWQRVSGDIHKPLPDTLKKPYLDYLLKLLGAIQHLFDNRLDSLQGRICVLQQNRMRDANFFNPRPQYTAQQQSMLNRLHQYDVFLERMGHATVRDESLSSILKKFDHAWSTLNLVNETACKQVHPDIQPILDALVNVAGILSIAINTICKIEKDIQENIHG